MFTVGLIELSNCMFQRTVFPTIYFHKFFLPLAADFVSHLSPYAYDRTDSFFLTVISLLIYISIGLITLLTKMRIMNWYTGKSLSNFKWSIVGNPRLDWFSFTPPSDWSKKMRRSLNQSDAKLKPIPTWSPAFSRFFPRFGFFFEFLLVLNGMELSTDYVLVLAISLVLILQYFIEKRSIYLTL